MEKLNNIIKSYGVVPIDYTRKIKTTDDLLDLIRKAKSDVKYFKFVFVLKFNDLNNIIKDTLTTCILKDGVDDANEYIILYNKNNYSFVDLKLIDSLNPLVIKIFIDSDIDDIDECNICFDMYENIKLCFNCSFKTCLSCSKKLSRCPICRK
jgi:hypothetical protein